MSCPSPARRANETAACTSCTSRPVVSLQLLAAGCLPPVEKAYCDLPDVGENKVSESCQVALTAAFQPLLKDPTGARGAEAIASWGQHMGDPGFYYQCDGTPGFQYWKVHPHGSADLHRDAWRLTGVRKLRRSVSEHDDRFTFGKQTNHSVDVNPDV